MRSVVIIPARFASSRYPGKPLVKILDKPMIIWVADLAAKAVGIGNVYVATDDVRIQNEVEKFGYSSVLTSKKRLPELIELQRLLVRSWRTFILMCRVMSPC